MIEPRTFKEAIECNKREAKKDLLNVLRRYLLSRIISKVIDTAFNTAQESIKKSQLAIPQFANGGVVSGSGELIKIPDGTRVISNDIIESIVKPSADSKIKIENIRVSSEDLKNIFQH